MVTENCHRPIDDDKNGGSNSLFAGKVVLAPMVRENSLPFRLLCLRSGADLVYTEEIIDFRFNEGRRIENTALGTVDFVDKGGNVILRTCPEERGKLVIQLGSCKPDRALNAAKLVSGDVVAVDFNFGCPKPFSLKGGMGAAMLDKPDEIRALLMECVQNLDIPVTCKIRILPDLGDTLKLVKLIESCGVAAIAVHGRCKDHRPHHECNNEFLKAIASSISIPMIANGGSNHINTYEDILSFRQATGASSVMVARAAMKNPSIFRSNGMLEPIDSIIHDFVKFAVRYENPISNTKYTLQTFIARGFYGKELVQRFHGTRKLRDICDLFGFDDWFDDSKLSSIQTNIPPDQDMKHEEESTGSLSGGSNRYHEDTSFVSSH